MSSSALAQQQVGEHTYAVVQQMAVRRRQYVRFGHRAVNPHVVSGFHPRLPRRLQQTTVDALLGLRRHIADHFVQQLGCASSQFEMNSSSRPRGLFTGCGSYRLICVVRLNRMAKRRNPSKVSSSLLK